MTRKRPTFLPYAVLAAVLAGVLAVVGIRASDPGRPPGEHVNERAGVLRGVRFGDSVARVRALLGAPSDDEQGFFPGGSDFTGPPSISAPASDRASRAQPETLHYEDAAYLVSTTVGVFAMATLAEGAETRAGVGVGHPLSEVRERYTRVDCGEAVAGAPRFGGRRPKYPWCRTRVGNVVVFLGEDPIESITLTRLG